MTDRPYQDAVSLGLPPLAAGYRRVLLIVLDGVGIGGANGDGATGVAPATEAPNTLRAVAGAVGGLSLPHLAALGLADLAPTAVRRTGGGEVGGVAMGSSARLVPASRGKDSLTGHWELAGLVTDLELRTFPAGFPADFMDRLRRELGRDLLGGDPAAGTEIIERLGPEHLASGALICYTSADSVLQLAAHEDVVAPAELYELCRRARRAAVGEYLVGRVIARPFRGRPGGFERPAGRRRDFSLAPPGPTVLDGAQATGVEVVTVGKVGDIFAGQGVTRSLPAAGNEAVVGALNDALAAGPTPPDRQLLFANLNDFDTLYGHRRDPAGFAAALARFDAALGDLLRLVGDGDLLLITADHGCDPTAAGTDHTREAVPLLIVGAGWPPACFGPVHGLTAAAGLVSAAFGLQGFNFWPRTG